MLWINKLNSVPQQNLRQGFASFGNSCCAERYKEIYFDKLYIQRIKTVLERDLQSHFIVENDTVLLYFSLEGSFDARSSVFENTNISTGTHNICFLPSTSGKLKCPCGKYDMIYVCLTKEQFKRFLPDDQPIYEEFRKRIDQNEFSFLRQRPAYINHKIRRIIEEICQNKEDKQLEDLFIKAKIVELLSVQFEELSKPDRLYSPLKKETADKIFAVRDFILEHLGEYHSLPSLAKRVGTNEFTLKKEFKKLIGLPVFGFWQEVKMEKAREMLLENEKSIKQISEIIGYKNPQHFSTAFKKEFGCPPSVYRKRLTPEHN